MLHSAASRRTVVELFAGAGMARLGLGEGGACVLANDIDPVKGVAYAANFGRDHLRVCDVAALTVDDLPREAVDLCWISPPCVGFSEAGDKQGFDEKQSGAFWPSWKLIEGSVAEGRAFKAIGFENVPGLLTSHGGADIKAIPNAFERADYEHATLAIDAKHFVPRAGRGFSSLPLTDAPTSRPSPTMRLPLCRSAARFSPTFSISTAPPACGSSRRPRLHATLR
jgi:DNA (cytosine-5)-methyltransferase 1